MIKSPKHTDLFGLAGFFLLVSFVFALSPLASALPAANTSVYEKPSSFLKKHFKRIPKTQLRTLSSTDQKALRKILGHSFALKKVRYWKDGDKTAWILEEIGKHEPITMGFITRSAKSKAGKEVPSLSEIRVLIYRESHGSEVRHSFFTKQFRGATLKGYKLNKKVDGIVGATLSVRALTKLSAAALYLSGTNK